MRADQFVALFQRRIKRGVKLQCIIDRPCCRKTLQEIFDSRTIMPSNFCAAQKFRLYHPGNSQNQIPIRVEPSSSGTPLALPPPRNQEIGIQQSVNSHVSPLSPSSTKCQTNYPRSLPSPWLPSTCFASSSVSGFKDWKAFSISAAVPLLGITSRTTLEKESHSGLFQDFSLSYASSVKLIVFMQSCYTATQRVSIPISLALGPGLNDRNSLFEASAHSTGSGQAPEVGVKGDISLYYAFDPF
jgi:hypothetical protein